jgi:hypothetical protein
MLGVLGIFKAKGTAVFNEVVSRPSEIIGGSLTSLLPIKCALGSQIYGTFLLNMALPVGALAVAALFMVPTALIEKCVRRRRTADAVPTFKGAHNIPRCLAVHTVMRAPMDEDDIAEWQGPFYPTKRLSATSVFLLFLLCVENHCAPPSLARSLARALSRARALSLTRALSRARVLSLSLSLSLSFGLSVALPVFGTPPRTPLLTKSSSYTTAPVPHCRYPTLVKSIASVFNCTDPIEGRRHLIADLTVVCYTEWHIAFLFFAGIGAAVYAIGIPMAVAGILALHSPVHQGENGKLQCRCCTRRVPAEYAAAKMRSRYAFLYNGYSTNRSGAVVTWEALVMLRKLAVALAGSLLRDPYLQILAALLVLVISCVVTAYVQPYETGWLNALDTFSLVTLIVTQILSIVYFYTATAQNSFMNPKHLDVLTTALLFVLNATVILLIGVLYAVELLDLRAKCTARSRATLKVASPEVIAAALRAHAAGDGSDPTHVWCHPSGIAVAHAPLKIDDINVWFWSDDDNGMAVSRAEPELLLQQANGDAVAPGETFRTMHRVTRMLSDKKTQLNYDVGGCGAASPVERRRDADIVAGRANPGIALVQLRIQGPDEDSDVGADAGSESSDGVGESEGSGAGSVAGDESGNESEYADARGDETAVDVSSNPGSPASARCAVVSSCSSADAVCDAGSGTAVAEVVAGDVLGNARGSASTDAESNAGEDAAGAHRHRGADSSTTHGDTDEARTSCALSFAVALDELSRSGESSGDSSEVDSSVSIILGVDIQSESDSSDEGLISNALFAHPTPLAVVHAEKRERFVL